MARSVIATGPSQAPLQALGGLGPGIRDAAGSLSNAYVQKSQQDKLQAEQDTQLQSLLKAFQAGTSPQGPFTVGGEVTGPFQNFPGQSNVPTQTDPQKVLQNLISSSGGIKAFIGNQDAVLKALDAIGQGSGGLDPATQAQLFGSTSPKQQLPVEKEVSPQQTPAQEKLIAQIDKIDARTEAIQSGSTESDDPFVKAYNAKNIGSTEEQQAERKSATLEGLERMRKNLQKSMGEESIDKKTGAINVGMEKEGGQQQVTPDDPEITQLKLIQNRRDVARKALASGKKFNKNVVTSLENFIKQGEAADKRIDTILDKQNTPLTDIGKVMEEVKQGRIPEAVGRAAIQDLINKDKSIKEFPTGEIAGNGQPVIGLYRVSDVPGVPAQPVLDSNGLPMKGIKTSGKLDIGLGGLAKKTIGTLQDDILSGSQQLLEFKSIKESLDPTFLTARGRAWAGLSKVINRLEIDKLPILNQMIDSEFLDKKTQWEAKTEIAFLKWRKWVTGVAGGPVEMQAIRESYLDSKGDSPVTFDAKLKAIEGITTQIIQHKQALLKQGIAEDSPEMQRLLNPIVNEALKASGLSQLFPKTEAQATPKSPDELMNLFNNPK